MPAPTILLALALWALPGTDSPSRQVTVPADTGHLEAAPGIQLFYRVLGGPHADTIVFVHGGPGLSSAYLAKDLDFLAARHTVVLYDQRGSGRSTLLTDSTQVSIALHVADLDAVRRHFAIDRANLYGHSWGAGLVANYVAVHPASVRRAILGSSIPPRRDPYMAQFGAQLTAWADSATQRRLAELARARQGAADPVAACRAYWALFIRGYFADTSTLASMRGDICDDPPASLSNRVNEWTLGPAGAWDWRTLLATTTVPVLVLHGDGDPIPMAAAREWVASIPGSRLAILEGAGHFPPVERPARMLAEIEAFFFPPPDGTAAMQADSLTVIHAGSVLDGRGGAVRDAWVVVRDGRIDRVATSAVRMPGATLIELGDATLMPGLIDAHVHPGWYVDRNGKRDSRRSGDSPAQAALARAGNLYATLMAGVTTIQSIGGPEDLELREATANGRIPGPRILTSLGPINDTRPTADSLRALVRARKLEGADLIKLFASSGLGAGGAQTLSDEQLGAICGEARTQGLRTLVHAISAGSVRAAVLAGCTQIEHGIFVTDAELQLMADHGTIFDPQVCLVFQNYVDHPDAYNFTDASLAPLVAALPTAAAMFTRALDTPGLRLVFGTDAVALAHGRNADELTCRVQAGQSPMAAIVSATSVGAEALGLGSTIGSVAAGYAADLIAVQGNPLADITRMHDVIFVMRNGVRYR